MILIWKINLQIIKASNVEVMKKVNKQIATERPMTGLRGNP